MTLLLLFNFGKRQYRSVLKRASAFFFIQHILYLLDTCSLKMLKGRSYNLLHPQESRDV